MSLTIAGYAQTYQLEGVIEDGKSGESIPNATIFLLDSSDSSQVEAMISDLEGRFLIASIKEGSYVLKIQYLGYQSLVRPVNLQNDSNLGKLFLREETTSLQEITVSGRRTRAETRKDTTQFNADAYQTMRDANAQNLLEKLPGISNEDGTLQAQGEQIAQILVDGEPFFGTDVKTALQNLPAEMIESIQVFDQLSEAARLSGFDDGERLKTINIITKPNRRKGQFGRTTAGYGTDDRYIAGASINDFDESRRLTFTGLTNNINVTDFSSDPNVQDNARPQDGLIKTHILGLNYSDKWGEKIKISGSYVFSSRENFGEINRFREFITDTDLDQLYTEKSTETRINDQHQFDLRFEYDINARNRIVFIPRVSARFETERSEFSGETSNGTSLINSVENSRTADNYDYDFFNRLFYSHKFAKPGRTLTFRGRISDHQNDDTATRLAENEFFANETQSQTIRQQINRNREGFAWETGLSFTEAISKRSQLELEYEIGNRLNTSDQLINDINLEDPANPILALDTALSNTFQSGFLTQETELGYQYKTETIRVQAELEYQHAQLDNTQGFPLPFELNRSFEGLLPTLRLQYQVTDNTNLQVDYDTWLQEPNLRQLQPVVDNSNPLQLYVGNPDLDQAYSNRIRVRFRSNNPETDRGWFVYAESRIINNIIANSSFIATEATEIQPGIVLEPGSQLFSPINLNGYWEFRSWSRYSMPFDAIKSNLSFSLGTGYTNRPTAANLQTGFNNSRRISTGISLSSNISDQIDFNLRTRMSFSGVENTINPSLNNQFFSQSTRLNFNWIIWKGLVYRMDLTNRINSGLSDGFNANFTLVNLGLGKKIFANERGEISLNVYDLFRQNNNIRRNITDTFIEDVQTNVLQRYFMLTFSYNIRRFSKGMDMDDYRDLVEPGDSRGERNSRN